MNNTLPISSSQRHVLKNITLRNTGERSTKTIGALYMHTWNTNYMSGYTVWSGKEYGNFFVRQSSTSTTSQGRRSRGRGR